jgi:hypothetical protein
MKQFEMTPEKKTHSVSISEPSAGILFCDSASATYSGYSIHLFRTAELNKTAESVIHTLQITVLSQAGSIKNSTTQPTDGIKENAPAYNSGAYCMQPFNIAKPGQETLSENTTPRGLLPP